MATKIITIHVDDEPVEVTLKTARKDDGIWRAELMAKAATEGANDARSMAAFYLYPTCVAAVKSPESIRNILLGDFMSRIDEADLDMWVSEAYELNPQWKASMKVLAEMSKEEEKKIGQPLTGSNMPMETQMLTVETSPALRS